MVLGRGFKSWLHLKTRWKDGPLDGKKSNEKIKEYPNGASHPKKYFLVTNIFSSFILDSL